MVNRCWTSARRRMSVMATVLLLATVWLASGVGNAAESLVVRTSTAGPIPVLRDDGRVWNVVRFEPGERVEIELLLVQRGPLPVRVSDARVTRRARVDACGWAIDEVELDRGGRRSQLGAGGESVTLARDEQIVLRLAGSFAGEPGCLPNALPVSRGALYLDTEVAMLPRQQRIPLPEVLTWSTDPDSSAARFARAPTAPRVGSAA